MANPPRSFNLLRKVSMAIFDDGRELELLNHIFMHPNTASFKGNPKAIIAEIDSFATRKYLTNIGEMKGRLVTDLIATHRPNTIIEVGTYIGYSTLLFASTLKSHPLIPTEKKYITLEQSPLFASITLSLVNLAGLSDLVQVIVGPSSESLRKLKSEMPRVDMLFLDHYNPLYTNDLKIVEEMGMIGVGSLLVADNVVEPLNPRYLEYVRMGVDQKLAVAEKVRIAEGGVVVKIGEWEKGGDPRLVYESVMFESFEPPGIPDAIEATICIRKVEEQINKPHEKRPR
ncbi:S-adenosyl-L-methionine-dependent methyltransferase [Tuber brumale]|nr:S-adenosyl-L-methionine-dependent methyltransferase [Tuber brumale]